MFSHTVSSRRPSRALNAAIFLAVLLLAGVLVRRFYFATPTEYDYKIAPHAKLSIPGVDWMAAGRTVLIVMRKDCKYCAESAAFYRRLVSSLTKEGNAKVIALFPEQESGAEAYVSELGIPISDVRYVSLDSLGIRNIPTLAIIDSNGVVTDFWVGKLPPRIESVVMKALNVHDSRPLTDWLIDERTFPTRAANHEPMVLLDVRDRAFFALKHKDGARNIPLDELRVRAANELNAADSVVLYGDDSETDMAYIILDIQGFSKLAIMAPDLTQRSNELPKQTP